MKQLLLFLVLLFSAFSTMTFGQYYSSGQDPASLKWNEINSENFQVIYPIGYDSIAQYVINTMEYGRMLTLKNRHAETKKISVILHNQTIVSNAEVAWAPRRVEFYTVSPQSTYSQPWYEQLAIHEYTHVIQISSMNEGLTKFLYHLFGEQITVGIFGLYVPYWFIEGDAVVAETALSKAGRGRDPNFESELRSQLLEIGSYSLEKASLGSYKDFTTDRYHLGYFLVGQGRAHFGKDFWIKPMLNVAKYPLAIIPFGQGIKTNSGMDKRSFYEFSMQDLFEKWQRQLEETNPDNVDILSDDNSFTNYTNHFFIDEDHIFSLKKNYHGIGKFISMSTEGKEEKLFTPGFYFHEKISMGGDKICWSERRYDARWGYRSFTKIMLYDIKTRKKKTLLNKTRYFSPVISSSGEKIVVVEVDEFSQHYLVVLDADNGNVLQRIQSPDNDFIAHPSWSQKEDKIIAEVLNSHGKGLAIFSLKNHKIQQVLSFQHTHLQYPSFWKKYLLFEAAYNGIMNVYALDLQSRSLYQTTNTAFGASDYSISPDGKTIVFAHQSSKGKQLVTQTWNPEDWIPMSEVKNNSYPLADILSEQVDTLLKPEFIPQENYDIKKYSKFKNLINIHSWNPLNVDLNNATLNPGVNILSQNKLSTLSARIGANYNFNSQAMKYYANVDFMGWYPVISLRADYGGRMTDMIENNDTSTHFWNESNMSAVVYLPLLFTSGTWSHRIQPQLSFNYKQVDRGAALNFNFRNIKSTDYSIQFSGQQKSPFQSIYPDWAYSLAISYAETPFNDDAGEMWSVNMATYLPGFFRHDGFRLMGTYQDKLNNSSFYSDMASPARGYSSISYKDLLTLRADYKVPLLYPDWNLSSLLYMKRIVMGLFYDYSIQADLPTDHAYHGINYFWSSGMDLTTDVHFLRSKFPFEIGVRGVYVDGYAKNARGLYFQFLFGLSI